MQIVRMFALTLALLPSLAGAKTLLIGTNQVQTFVYGVGAAVAKTANEAGLRVLVQPYSGTSTVMPLCDRGEVDFCLANELEASLAVSGTKIFKKPNPHLRVVAVLTPLHAGFFVPAHSSVRFLEELKGKRIGTEYGGQKIIVPLIAGELANVGLSYVDVRGVPAANMVQAADAFADGDTDALYFAFGAAKLREISSKLGPLRVLSIDPMQNRMVALRRYVPPAYAVRLSAQDHVFGVEAPTWVMALDYLLLTSKSASRADVSKLVRALYYGRATLVASFRGLSGFSPKQMVKQLASGLAYHPAAIEFYKKQGLWPPKR